MTSVTTAAKTPTSISEPSIVVEDALSANAPHLDDLREARMHYIIGVKPGDHAFLFQHLRDATP